MKKWRHTRFLVLVLSVFMSLLICVWVTHEFQCFNFCRPMSFHFLVWMIHEFVGRVWSICFLFWFWTNHEFPYFGLNNDSWVCLMLMTHMFLCSGFERSMSFHILVWIMIHEFVGSIWSICFYVLVLNDQWVSIFWFKWSMSFLEAYDPYVFCSGFELSMGFHDLVWMIYEFCTDETE